MQVWLDMVACGKGWKKRIRERLRALVLAFPGKLEFASMETEAR